MQYNIYIRKDNWESFDKETNKSELINSLLSDYYNKRAAGNVTQVTVDEFNSTNESLISTTKATVKDIVKNLNVNTCPHGFAKGFCKKMDCNRRYS